jgi:acetyl esterase/lipase
VIAIAALVAIGLDAGYTINGVLSSNTPTLAFTLGPAYRDLNYCGSQTLDLYVPAAAARRPLPLAVFVHGGGTVSGDKTNLKPVFLNALASAGYAVASVNYRLAPMAKFPAQLEDVKCAIRYLRDRAAAYGLDPSEIFAFGTSVGGQFVVIAALTGPHSIFDVGPYLSQPSTLKAVVDIFGPANLSERAGFTPAGMLRVFGANSSQSDLVRASPTHYVVPNAPPIMLVHGIQDAKVPESQSIELYNDLIAAGDTAEFVPVQNMGHLFAQVGSKPIDPSLEQIGQDIVDFFNRYLEGS